MSFLFNDVFRNQADWVDLSLAVANFDQVRRPMRCNIRLFQSQGWSRQLKPILSVNTVLKRRMQSVRFENLPLGVPIYLHISGDCVLANGDAEGLASGVEQFLGNRAQVRLVALKQALQPQPQQQPQQQRQRQRAPHQAWATGPRRFEKMYSLSSRQSLMALSQYAAAVESLEQRAQASLKQFAAAIKGNEEIDLKKVRNALRDLDDELTDLRSTKLDSLELDGLRSGAELATEKLRRLTARAEALSTRLEGALVHPDLPEESEDELQAASSDGSDEDSDDDHDDDASQIPAAAATVATSSAETQRQAASSDASEPASKRTAVDAPTLDETGRAPTASVIRKTARSSNAGSNSAAASDTQGAKNVISPPKFQKQYSVISQQRLVKLADIRERVDVLHSNYEGYRELLGQLDTSTSEGVEKRAKIKVELGQLYGILEKLQFKEIDAILVGDLTSGKDDARAQRKQLTRDVTDLVDNVRTTVQNLKKQMGAAKAGKSSE